MEQCVSYTKSIYRFGMDFTLFALKSIHVAKNDFD